MSHMTWKGNCFTTKRRLSGNRMLVFVSIAPFGRWTVLRVSIVIRVTTMCFRRQTAL